MSATHLIAAVRNLFPNARHHSRRLAELEQSLEHVSELLNDRIKENTALKKERDFIHDIYLHRSGCKFDMQFDGSGRLLLFTTSLEPNKKSIIIHLPAEQLRLAEIHTYATKDALVIDSIHLNLTQCDIRVGRFILQKLIAQAKSLCLSLIEGQLLDSASMPEQVEFFRQSGFETPEDFGQGANILLYRLKKHSV